MSTRSRKQSKSSVEHLPVTLYQKVADYLYDEKQLRTLEKSSEITILQEEIYERVASEDIVVNIDSIPVHVWDDLAAVVLEAVRESIRKQKEQEKLDAEKREAFFESKMNEPTPVESGSPVQQMSLPQFIKEYNMPRVSVDRLIHTHGFPAYKLGGRWYIDIPAFEKWREQEHRRQYKYAK